MNRALILLAAVTACGSNGSTGPGAGSGGEAETRNGEADTTTGSVSTGDASTTGEAPVCAWWEPENRSYCPLLAAPNIDLVGDTPMGSVTFGYAYFGLFLCDWCPHPEYPSLGLFAQEQSPGLDPLVGDYLLFQGIHAEFGGWVATGDIGGERVKFDPMTTIAFPTLMLATVEQTTPPLDPDAAPTMAGEISIVGEGWMLVGEFNASLCTTLDWTPPCE